MIYKKIVATAFAMAVSGVALAADFKAGEDYILTGAAGNKSEKVQVTEFFGYWCPHCNNFEPLLEKWVEENAAKVDFSRVPVAFSTNGPNQTLAQKAYYIGKQVKAEKAVDSTMFDFYHKYGRLAGSFKDLDKIKNDPLACNNEVNKLVDRAEKQSASANRPFDVVSATTYLTENVCETDARGWELLKLGQKARGGIRSDAVLENIIKIAGVDTNNFDKRLNSFSMKSALKTAASKSEAMGIDSVPTIVVNDKYRVVSSKGFEHMLEVVEYLIEKESASIKN
ncbi:MAG: putative DsbA family dithiol-disulfide isomerase [Oceanospirillaceae bacterium]|jgi:predicted DsbA family dithiol-disulfide isomerase